MKRFNVLVFSLIALSFLLALTGWSSAYDRFGNGCNTCHGKFTDTASPRGPLPANKHNLHRDLMLTDVSTSNDRCYVCHTVIGDKPLLKSSKGNSSLPGISCAGCHSNTYGTANLGAGLRKHHQINGVTVCAGCHAGDPVPAAENVNPPYYGKAGVNLKDALNRDGSEDYTGDGIGLDNDGNNLYDTDDPAAFSVSKPAARAVVPSGSNYLITWSAVAGAATYKVSFSIDNGLTWTVIDPAAATASTLWAVPNTFTQNKPNSMIMVQAYNASSALIGTAKSGKFSILVLKITAPTAGAIVPQGTVYNVAWVKKGTSAPTASVVVWYSINSGVSWTRALGTADGTKLSFAWNIPAVTTATAKLKVVLKSSAGAVTAMAISAPFKIQ
jgi:hypothetical protein